jgi:hypothetical protein
VPAVEHVQSRSFLPVLRGHTDNHRDSALYAYNNQRVGLTSGEWTLLRYHDPDAAPPLIYTQQIEQTAGFGYHRRQQRRLDFADIEPGRFLPGINTPVWRRQLGHDAVRHPTEPRDDLLFHNPSDPGQLYNLAAQRPDILQQMVEKLRARAQTVHAPDEQFARLHL